MRVARQLRDGSSTAWPNRRRMIARRLPSISKRGARAKAGHPRMVVHFESENLPPGCALPINCTRIFTRCDVSTRPRGVQGLESYRTTYEIRFSSPLCSERSRLFFPGFFDLGPGVAAGDSAIEDQSIRPGVRIHTEIALALKLETVAVI